MTIEVELYEEAPKCPKCKVPMSLDGADTQIEYDENIKMHLARTINLYRCPKCFNLYKEV